MSPPVAVAATGVISTLAVGGVILRPFGWSEWVFATAGAALLVALQLLSPADALQGIAAGTDVYLFLAGMMLLAEIARREGLFDYLAARAAGAAKGSPQRLFALVYLVGTAVTVFLSNDATAVVLTPAVIAVARAAKVKDPIPYLLACAFVANAASFVLPISNPANIVVFGEAIPPLGAWLARFALPSLAAILATYGALFLITRKSLGTAIVQPAATPRLSRGGRIAAIGLILAVAALLTASALGTELGLPTAMAGAATLAFVTLAERRSPFPALSGVSWSTLVLVAGLFVIVRALDGIGLEAALVAALQATVQETGALAAPVVGGVVAVLTNLTNNLPLGLVSGGVVAAADAPPHVTDAILIGIDLGPNISVTGSLATILWLIALRREGIAYGALPFLKVGIIVTLPALALALLATML
ncbi:arsenic transporter [Jiella endophytica]|uniref:Arsenic transporter n=1 Tax=Jiella endophytica TaxID=2558362 RepID=A0A4Y8RGT0_9HYPH|nr:arsenic transporter [Jiella endophytica]TFF20660.1 arsenic transporter [Jiella endophytica]TFF26961.1 arsenic transporter [Jiella endophytica]